MPKRMRAAPRAEPCPPLRLVLIAPPPDVWFALQPKNGAFEQRRLSGERNDGRNLAFELELRVGEPLADGAPRLLGARGTHARGAHRGVARDGGPACATVPLLAPGWSWRSARGRAGTMDA